jgi:hypothetical protein
LQKTHTTCGHTRRKGSEAKEGKWKAGETRIEQENREEGPGGDLGGGMGGVGLGAEQGLRQAARSVQQAGGEGGAMIQ